MWSSRAAAPGSICFEFPWEILIAQQNSLMHVLGKTMKLPTNAYQFKTKPKQTTVLIRFQSWHIMSTMALGTAWQTLKLPSSLDCQILAEAVSAHPKPQCCSLSAKFPIFLQPRPYLDTDGCEHTECGQKQSPTVTISNICLVHQLPGTGDKSYKTNWQNGSAEGVGSKIVSL